MGISINVDVEGGAINSNISHRGEDQEYQHQSYMLFQISY
jgi:hypothetical protein